MKLFLLFAFSLSTFIINAQEQVQRLPEGRYETRVNDRGWEKGDIVLIKDEKYMISSSKEVGEFRFSVTAQRIFFTSGPLKGIYAKTRSTNGSPSIFIPINENEQLGFKLAPDDIVGSFRQ